MVRLVEIGRVIYIRYGEDTGKLAVIVDVIDDKRALIDGPTTGVIRQQLPFTRMQLTEFVLPLKRNAKTANVGKVFDS